MKNEREKDDDAVVDAIVADATIAVAIYKKKSLGVE